LVTAVTLGPLSIWTTRTAAEPARPVQAAPSARAVLDLIPMFPAASGIRALAGTPWYCAAASPASSRPAEPWIIEAINEAFAGVPLYRVVHICYGHEEGQPGILDLKANRLFPWAFDLDCDQIHIQMASHDFA
jgi:hypothetical protein